MSDQQPKVKLTNWRGLSANDISDFIIEEDHRAYMHLPVLATTPHGTYTFVITDIALLDDNTFMLYVKEKND